MRILEERTSEFFQRDNGWEHFESDETNKTKHESSKIGSTTYTNQGK